MSKLDELADKLARTIKNPDEKPKPQAYDTQAEVVRTDGNTAWVKIPGGVDETPVRRTIDCKEGDSVQVRVGGGTAWLTGNATAPPTDDTTANTAVTIGNMAQQSADDAQATADDNSVKIEKLGDELNLQVKNSDDQFSQINIKIDGISSTVQESEGKLSTLEQTVDSLSTRVQTSESDYSTLSLKVDSIDTEVASASGTATSAKETADRFEARVSNIEYDMSVYMSFSRDGLILGRSDSDYKLRLTNEGIDFLFDNDEIGRISYESGDPMMYGDAVVLACGASRMVLSNDSAKQYFAIDGRLFFIDGRWKNESVNGTSCPIIPITLGTMGSMSPSIIDNQSIPTKKWVLNYAAKQGSEQGNIPSFYNVYLQELADDRNNSYTPNVFVSRSGAFHTTIKSSRRWKHNITNFEDVFNYEDLYKLPVRSFIYNLDKMDEDDPRYGVETPGFIAEEVHDTIPIAADMSEDKTQVDNWNDRIMIPYMVKAIQEQHKEIMKLETKISNLETRLAELEAKLK